MHILNHCHGVLNLSRYNLIHDAVLKVSDEVVKENCPKEPGGTYSQTFQTLLLARQLVCKSLPMHVAKTFYK